MKQIYIDEKSFDAVFKNIDPFNRSVLLFL